MIIGGTGPTEPSPQGTYRSLGSKMHADDLMTYIIRTKNLVNHHSRNGQKSAEWDTILSTTTLALALAQGLTMTIQTVLEAPSTNITITGASFAAVIGLTSKIKDNFSFKALSYQHHNISDDYNVLYTDMKNFLKDIEDEQFDSTAYKELLTRFNIIASKGHLQEVRSCGFIFCCLRQIKNVID